jgi:hypothetical protein
MATTDDLIISIRADMGRLESQLRDVNSQLRGTERQGNETANAIKGMAIQFLSLGVAIEGLKKLVDVNREFGILKAGLETATGSAQGANEAFGALQQFAQQTPYDLAQTVEAFTLLVNLGLTPSERAMKSYGDTSAALGKDLKQMVEAVADAANGGFVRLEEFGIKFKNEGDNVKFTFKGVTETVKNNAAAIEEYLIKLGEINFNGAMEKRMASLDGAISNLGDSWDALFRKIGDSGLTQVANTTFRRITDALNELTEKLDVSGVEDFNNAIETLFDSIMVLVGIGLTRLAANLAISTQSAIQNMIAQRQLAAAALSSAEADSIAANIAVRRSVVEKELAIDSVNRARAQNTAAIASLENAQADAQNAAMTAALARNTANAEVAELARTMALERVAVAQANVTRTSAAMSAAINTAATASSVHTTALATQTAAQTALNTTQAASNTATRTASSLLTALGGPLGAVITALGLGATAWLAFGDNSQTAAEKALDAGKRIKEGFSGANDALIQQQNGLAEVNGKILKLTKTIDEWNARGSGIRLIDKETELASLQQQRKAIEENINLIRNQSILDSFLSDNGGDKYGVKKEPQKEPQKDQADDKKAAQEAKKLEQLKQAAQEYLKSLAESNMTELQLNEQKYIDTIKQLNSFLETKAITEDQHWLGRLDAIEIHNTKKNEILKAQADAELKAILDQQAREDEAYSKRIEQQQAIIQEAINGGLTELELMDKQHAEKMDKIQKLAEGEFINKQALLDAEFALEQQHQARRLDLILGTGSKIQELNKAFQKGQLQGTLAFFAADFGGMSQHSRKMFELTKAARLAEAVINIPSTVMAAVKHGTEMGGWPVGAAMGAAALASQLSQLRAIQSASFGGGSSGSAGGGGAGVGASGAASAEPQQQQPIMQRFVNLHIYGDENTMFSRDSVLKLMDRFGEEIKDGAVLRVV